MSAEQEGRQRKGLQGLQTTINALIQTTTTQLQLQLQTMPGILIFEGEAFPADYYSPD